MTVLGVKKELSKFKPPGSLDLKRLPSQWLLSVLPSWLPKLFPLPC